MHKYISVYRSMFRPEPEPMPEHVPFLLSEYIRKGRLLFVLIIFCASFSIVLLRLFSLQTGDENELKNAATAQHSKSVLLFRKRGDLLDRNGVPFTNRESQTVVVFEPLKLFENSGLLEYCCELFEVNAEDLRKDTGFGKAPVLFNTTEDKINELLSSGLLNEENPGMSIVSIPDRYGSSKLASHVLGYLRGYDGSGLSGVEEYYENDLKGHDVYITVARDALNMPIAGTGMKIEGYDNKKTPSNVVLTIDYEIQKIVEEEMDLSIQKGAVVVLDIKSGDILALSSRPDFYRNDIQRLVNMPEDSSLFNRAVAAYSPGSVFKIVDSAVALTEGIYTNYKCSGTISFPGLSFSCYGKYAHGNLNLDEAFSLSCNTYFINLAINTGAEKILNMAAKMGFSKETGLMKQGLDESAGNIPSASKKYTYGETGNIAIGQGEVSVTPVQVASLIAAIANNGLKQHVNIIDSIQNINGKTEKKIRIDTSERILPVHVARMLGELMRKVTAPGGTGYRANLDDIGGAAGKTGSAEAYGPDGEKTVHAWFAGYFPYENPKYAIAVFVEDGGTGGDISAPVFSAIAQRIYFGFLP